ncbi:gamma-tubulin complex component protein [Tuber borchii]|uniref:Spindle pole body component n=1 Tax=Tuber borchii TaxID=42251 RepID=A0A2T6ZV20_TUBBO|nr:gamma-tubulin complex component protein [Tuber borchii]
MLHELFLLLSGHPSPILTPSGLLPSFPLVSPSERALLSSLSSLGHLHISLRNACSTITTTHPSTIARAVASGISTSHLHAFRARILLVEQQVLSRSAGMVGGYDIVSLAKIMSGFEGWERILSYLHSLASAMGEMSGGELINRLRTDIHTGFPTLEAVSLHLLKIAETAWLREVSTWVLYGRLPSSEDFFITESESVVLNPVNEDETGVLKEYTIAKSRLPSFVTLDTASSILFIGRALSIIRLRGGANTETMSDTISPEMTLLPVHLSYLQSLQSPLSPQKLHTAISEIRLSLSKHTLQTLLPASKIIDVVHVLREFFLLGRGEFAGAIVEQASEQVRNRWRRPGAGGGMGASGVKSSSSSAIVKEGEVSSILTRTWGVLSSLQGEETTDERLDTARDLLYLSLVKPPPATSAASTPVHPKARLGESFKDLLVGVPITLNFHLSWPLELFLQPVDLETYDAIFAYLVSVRRTLIRLQTLWRGRRYPPSPLAFSKSENRAVAKARREVIKKREGIERVVWATAGLNVFFLEALVGYWQGEVVEGAFRALMDVLGEGLEETPEEQQQWREDEDGDVWMAEGESEDVKSVEEKTKEQQDPESLMREHHLYLSRLKRGLFLADHQFAPLLKKFLIASEALASHVERMGRRNHLTDLNITPDSSTNEREVAECMASCRLVRNLLGMLVERLQRMDEERDIGGGELLFSERKGGGGVGKIDRLLMRLDLANLRLGD